MEASADRFIFPYYRAHRCRVGGVSWVAVRFWVRTYRTPYLLERRMELRGAEPALFLDERLVNEGAETLAPMWGHHPAFGPPFLQAGCRVDLPDCQAGSAPGRAPSYAS